ncbi:hypothetical protein WJX77_010168 [Trebouxia sp. C0004]
MASRNESIFDDAAEESDDQQQEDEQQAVNAEGQVHPPSQAGSDVDSSEEEEGGNEYDMTDKFIAPEDEEDAGDESESDQEGGRRKKRKRRRREEEELDEEDFALLEEQGVRVDNMRRKQAAQRKRIRKRQDESAARQGARTAEEQVQHELFGEQADAGIEDEQDDGLPQHQTQMRYDEEGIDSEDDFIDDDLGEGIQGQQPRRARGKGRTAGVHSQAVQEAFDIFGDVGELLEMYDARKRTDTDDAEAEQEPDFSDEEAAETFRIEQEEKRSARAFEKLAGKIEPGMMAKHFMRPEDNVIRTTDLPEREQTYRGADPANMDYKAMSLWVHKRLLGEEGGDQETKLGDLLSAGIREVDGSHVHYRDLYKADRYTDLSHGFRGVRRYRDETGQLEWRDDDAAQTELKASVERVLRLMYEEHYEVPFIGMYRKESCGDLLVMDDDNVPAELSSGRSHFPAGSLQAHYRQIRQWQVLYAVQAFGDKWRALERRKDRQRQAFDTAIEMATDLDYQSALEDARDQLDQAMSHEEVEDLDRQLRLMSDTRSAQATADGMRELTITDKGRASMKILAHTIARKAGLGPAVADVFLPPASFGQNLETSTIQNTVSDTAQPPEEFTAQYVSEGFPTMERVLEGMHKMAVADIAAEASVRKHVRDLYTKFAVVSTAPTLSGEAVLTPFHPYGTVRHIQNKPVKKFTDRDQFLLIAAAEKEGLLKVQFKVVDVSAENKAEDALLKQTKELYLSQSVSTTAKAWNDVREKVLQDALDNVLKPQFERELRAKLVSDAREFVCSKCSSKVWRLATQAPVQIRDRDNHVLEDRRFMVVVWGPGGQGPSTTLVMVDHEGNLVDLLYCGQLSGAIRQPPGLDRNYEWKHAMQEAHKAKDLQRMQDFVLEHVPHVILVAAAGQHSQTLEFYIHSMLGAVLNDNAKVLTGRSESGTITAFLADQTIAQLWETSAAAREELTDQPPLVRRAVAMARAAISGNLPVLCSLAGMSREILALQMHPMQKAVTGEELYKAVEQALVTATCQVGVDLNLAAQTPWLAHQLQFVAGLGPRKAMALLKAVQRQEQVAARKAVWKELNVIGKKVFWNAAGALRIRRSAAGLTNEELDPLDDTRVHPESYKWAIAMCQEALQGSKLANLDDDDQIAVEKAISKPELVEKLDLAGFSLRLQQDQDQTDRLSTLIDISFELVLPYSDLRPENPGQLTISDTFWLLTGETPSTLKLGRRVQATIMGLSGQAAYCSLPDLNDMEAVILADDISSSGPVRPGDRLRRGDTVPARIKQIYDLIAEADKDGHPVLSNIYLTTTSTAMASDRPWEKEYCTDDHYRAPSDEERAKLQAERNRNQRKQQFVSRTIFHPSFKNVSMPEAIGFLGKEGETSRWLFRPSNKGTHQISITMKLHTSPDGNALFLHQDIREGRKQSGGVGGHLKLGTPLTIQMPGSDALTFEDLDDVIANFAEPYLENVRALVAHRKFMDGDWERDLQPTLRAENPKPAYRLGIRYEQPGIFFLGFVMRSTPARENFSVLPSGYYFRKKVVSTIDAAIDKFKRNPVPLEMQAGAPQHHAPYQQYPTAGSTAVSGAYQDPQNAYPAAAGATVPYAGAAYNAAYSHGQYGGYSQQPYQQPYAAAAAQGVPGAYDQQSYAYMQQPADAQAPPATGSWLSQYQTAGAPAGYAAAGYAYAGQPATHNSLGSQQNGSQYPAGLQPPAPPSEVPPPPPI